MPYDATTKTVRQTDDWSCSVASTTWLLHSLGYEEAYPGPMESAMLADGLVSREQGLLDGSGSALAKWLDTVFDLPAKSVASIDWAWLQEHAGTVPIIIGGHGWNHWSGVRSVSDGLVQLANPAEQWMRVYQEMDPAEFDRLGPFSAVYVEPEDMAKIAELETRLGYCQGDVADALEKALEGARRARSGETRAAAFEALEAAINSLREA
jgi:hypothetical protein